MKKGRVSKTIHSIWFLCCGPPAISVAKCNSDFGLFFRFIYKNINYFVSYLFFSLSYIIHHHVHLRPAIPNDNQSDSSKLFPTSVHNGERRSCTHACTRMHRKTRPLNFTYFQLCRQTSEVFHVSTCSTRTYVCVCVDFPEALFATIAAATSAIAVASRQRGRAIVAAAREAAVKNISFLSPLSIAHSRYRIYTM